MNRRDILRESDQVKFQIYETIHARWQAGATVRMEEHYSGFPAIRIDCEEISVLTDILSLERWWNLKQEEVNENDERMEILDRVPRQQHL